MRVPRVTFEFPSLLADVLGQVKTHELEADSLHRALEALVRDLPQLEPRLFDEQGGFRQHVLCFHNGRNTRWLEGRDVPLCDGDRIAFLHAVSGG